MTEVLLLSAILANVTPDPEVVAASAARASAEAAIERYYNQAPGDESEAVRGLLKARVRMLSVPARYWHDAYSTFWAIDERLLDAATRSHDVCTGHLLLVDMINHHNPYPDDNAPEGSYTTAVHLFTDGKRPEAFQDLDRRLSRSQLIVDDPRDSVGEAALAIHAAAEGHLQDAAAKLRSSMALNSDFKFGHLVLGMIDQTRGDVGSARSEYLTIIETPTVFAAVADTEEAAAATWLLLYLPPFEAPKEPCKKQRLPAA